MPNVGQRGQVIRKMIGLVRTHDYPYEERPRKKINWTSYDTAQVNEIADVLDMIRVVVDVAAERIEKRRRRTVRDVGRPEVPTADVVKVLMAQSYFGVANRTAEGLIRLFWRQLGLSQRFSYKTIERGYDKRAVNALLNEILKVSNAPIVGFEKAFGPDGTGTPTSTRQHYAKAREGQRKKDGTESSGSFPKGDRDFFYSVPVVGAVYKLVAAWRGTNRHDVSELSFFEPLMRETKELHPEMDMIFGDGLYATRPCANLARELGAVLRSLPRRNVTLKRLGSDSWIEMLMAFSRDPQGWLREYYQREASEGANSSVKRRNPAPLRKRLIPRRSTEDKLRWLCYNVIGLCYLSRLGNVLIKPLIRGQAGRGGCPGILSQSRYPPKPLSPRA